MSTEETNDAIPQIGRGKDLLTGIRKIVDIVQFHPGLTVEELQEEMEYLDDQRETQLFSNYNDWLMFTIDPTTSNNAHNIPSSQSSIEILVVGEDGTIDLSDDGKELISGEFDKKAFNLMVQKSTTNFRYFYRTIQEIDKKVKSGNQSMGSNLNDRVNSMMKRSASGNTVTAGAIAAFLKDFGIVYKEEGTWYINPAQYAYLKGDDSDIVEGLLSERGSMSKLELERRLSTEFEWDQDRVSSVIDELWDDNSIYVEKQEGRNIVFLNQSQ